MASIKQKAIDFSTTPPLPISLIPFNRTLVPAFSSIWVGKPQKGVPLYHFSDSFFFYHNYRVIFLLGVILRSQLASPYRLPIPSHCAAQDTLHLGTPELFKCGYTILSRYGEAIFAQDNGTREFAEIGLSLEAGIREPKDQWYKDIDIPTAQGNLPMQNGTA